MATGDTSFNELTVIELKAVAEQFAVDLDGITKKADIIKELGELGVTWQAYAATLEPEVEEEPDILVEDPVVIAPVQTVVVPVVVEPVEEEVDDVVLLKMTRLNFTYEVRGYRFTRDHPYVLVASDDADYLVEEDGGFRMASPRELREFYGA